MEYIKLKTIILVFGIFVSQSVYCQQLTFFSQELELGIRNRLNLNATTAITSEILDTVTALDLSGLEISDIRDMVYFPNIKELNLANNYVSDISVLAYLSTLSYLDVSNNYLENIDMLMFTNAQNLFIIVSFNYIKDFSMLYNDFQNKYTLVGENLQHLPYRVNSFYTDYNLSDMSGLVNSNIWCLHANDTCLVDNGGQRYQVFPDSVQQTSVNASSGIVILINEEGAKMDSTYFIPPVTVSSDSDSIFLVPQFPDATLQILSAEAFHSTVTFGNSSVLLIKPDSIESDTVKIAFGLRSENSIEKLKGYTYFLIQKAQTGISDLEKTAGINIYPNPAKEEIFIKSELPIQKIEIYSLTGSLLLLENNFDEKISVSALPQGVYMVKIYTENGTAVKKVVKE